MTIVEVLLFGDVGKVAQILGVLAGAVYVLNLMLTYSTLQ